MKTLLQINTNVGWNSTGRISEEIGKYAIERGWLSTIAYGRKMDGKPASASRLIRVGKDTDIILHGIGTRLFDRHGLFSKRATKDLIKRIEEIRPDIIQLHNIHGYYLNYQELFAYFARTGIPVVWTLHDCWPFTGHCAYFDIADCRKWINGCNHCQLKRMYPASFLCDNSEINYELKKQAFTSLENLHIVTVSKWLNEVVKNSFLDRFPSYVIYNGIDISSYSQSKIKKEPIVLGVASKWDARKGLDTFVDLRKKLPKKYRIVLIGLSPGQIRNLPKGIEGIPRINEQNVLNTWYHRALVFVNPSLCENLPTTNMEAQACGTPVVAFDCGGMRETITDKTGILVKENHIDGLVEAIMEIDSNKSIYCGEDCIEHIENKFNKKKNFISYIDLYDSILAARDVKIPNIGYQPH